jgi:hypothetical protein
MRLVVQAQMPAEQVKVRNAFAMLGNETRRILVNEMSLTGIDGEAFAQTPALFGRPAFLVSYSPAFLRSCVRDDPHAALYILAEVYRAARLMFPCTVSSAEQTNTCSDECTVSRSDACATSPGSHLASPPSDNVTISIEQLKARMNVSQIVREAENGRCWVLVRKGIHEASVEAMDLDNIAFQSTALSERVLMRIWRGAFGNDEKNVSRAAAPPPSERSVI